jgi:chromosome segregation ATPase
MDNLDLNTLGLAKKWPKLDLLQSEVADLQKRLSSDENQVRQLEGALAGARAKELDAAAVRKGKEVPHGTHEDSAKRSLEAAQRDRDVLAKAVESAQADLAAFRAAHQSALYERPLRGRCGRPGRDSF